MNQLKLFVASPKGRPINRASHIADHPSLLFSVTARRNRCRNSGLHNKTEGKANTQTARATRMLTGASTKYADNANVAIILCAATYMKFSDRRMSFAWREGCMASEPAYMSQIVAIMEQRNATKSATMKALKANFLARVGVPPFWWSSAMLPPGMVKSAANVTVAISTETITRFWAVLSYFFSSFSRFGTVMFSYIKRSSRWGPQMAPICCKQWKIQTCGFWKLRRKAH